MATTKKVIGTDPNGLPIYEPDPGTYTPPVQMPEIQMPNSSASSSRPTYGAPAQSSPQPNPYASDGTTGGDFRAAYHSDAGQAATAIMTGGMKGGGDAQRYMKVLSGLGPVMDLFGSGSVPNNFDSKGELAKSEAMAGAAYQNAMGQAAGISGADPSTRVRAGRVVAPAAIQEQTVGTPDVIGGKAAADLRAQQLTQAAAAASSPSSATAQMRSNLGAIHAAQLGQAAGARGADRAAARRDAMLGTGTAGIFAANSTAALAAQEAAAKQQAYTAALSGVRAGDVSTTQAGTQIGALNQGANLQAQERTAGNVLATAQGNQQADLAADTYSAGNKLQSWTAKQAAANAATNTALQAVGAQNQAQGVAAQYETGINQAQTQNKGALVGAIGSVVGKLSDERAKVEVSDVGSSKSTAAKYGDVLSDAYGIQDQPATPYAMAAPQTQVQDFLKWKPSTPPAKDDPQGGGAGLVGSIVGAYLSDERAKQEVDQMSDDDIADFTRKAPAVTYRYKPGIPGTDGGESYRAGTLAQGVEDASPLGRMFVDERPDGLKEVQYGPMAHFEAKGAQATADKAYALALAALATSTPERKKRTGPRKELR